MLKWTEWALMLLWGLSVTTVAGYIAIALGMEPGLCIASAAGFYLVSLLMIVSN